MRCYLWIVMLAILSTGFCTEEKTKSKEDNKKKRQLDNIRSPEHFQYSLVLPYSRVASFRSLSQHDDHLPPRGSRLPPYAVPMEPIVQYSQKDPLYDPSQEGIEDGEAINKNELQAESKVLNIQDDFDLRSDNNHLSENIYGSYISTAPLFSHGPGPRYYDEPEPIIEIIIKESNESLPAPPPPPPVKKEPIQVFYVKYGKDPSGSNKIVYEKPIPAITPPSNVEAHHHENVVTVTPEPYQAPQQTTTLRTIIKPESEEYHSESGIKVTFGTEDKHHREDVVEGHEESAPRPLVAFPTSQTPSENVQQPRNVLKPSRQQFAQNRIQYQPINEQPPLHNGNTPFRNHQPQMNRQGQFGQPPNLGPSQVPFVNHPPQPAFRGPLNERPRPNPQPSFHPRPLSQNIQHKPPPGFHSGPTRPFIAPSAQPIYFNEPKYLQENYHTITTEQVNPSKEQPKQQPPSFNFLPGPVQHQPNQSPPGQIRNQQPLLTPLTGEVFAQQNSQNRLQPVHSNQSPQRPIQQTQPQYQFSQQIHHPNHYHQFSQQQPIAPQHFPQQPPITPQHLPQQAPVNTHFQQHQQPQQKQPLIFLDSRPPAPVPNRTPINHHNIQSRPGELRDPNAHIPVQQSQFSFHPSPPKNLQELQSFNNPGSQQLPIFPGPTHIPSFQPIPSAVPLQTRPAIQSPSIAPTSATPQTTESKDEVKLNFHKQNLGSLLPNGGELVASISKYEQHITENAPTEESFQKQQEHQQQQYQQQHIEQQNRQHHQKQVEQQHRQHHHKQTEQQQRQQQQQQVEQQQRQQEQQAEQQQHHQQQKQQQQLHEQSYQQQQENLLQPQPTNRPNIVQTHQQYRQQQQYYDPEQQQLQEQLARNVQKQQEEIKRLQAQILRTQNQQLLESHSTTREQTESTTSGRSASPNIIYASNPTSPYYQSTSRSVSITPTTQKYVTSTFNSVDTKEEAKKNEKKKKTVLELPDEVPDDLREHLLSSGILDNADISILDYDKVGDTPLNSLPPDQLANFFSAGGAQQIASSETKSVVVNQQGENVSLNLDDMEVDQDQSASENIETYEIPSSVSKKQEISMKVVHFDPTTKDGQKIASDYVQKDAKKIAPVALNDKKYNRYLPLKVRGNQFPVPDILKDKKVTSVVVLAPVDTEPVKTHEHSRPQRAAEDKLKGIKFAAGESLEKLIKEPTRSNFERWLDEEKNADSGHQAVILLVTQDDEAESGKEIYMYDIVTKSVNKLNGDLSEAFVKAAETNSLTNDINNIAIAGDGEPEQVVRAAEDTVEPVKEQKENIDEVMQLTDSEEVPSYVDLSSAKIDDNSQSIVSISSGYSKTSTEK